MTKIKQRYKSERPKPQTLVRAPPRAARDLSNPHSGAPSGRVSACLIDQRRPPLALKVRPGVAVAAGRSCDPRRKYLSSRRLPQLGLMGRLPLRSVSPRSRPGPWGLGVVSCTRSGAVATGLVAARVNVVPTGVS